MTGFCTDAKVNPPQVRMTAPLATTDTLRKFRREIFAIMDPYRFTAKNSTLIAGCDE